MAKGEVPIPYIIALVLAIVVIGLAVYWLYSSNIDFSKTINEYSCRSKKDAYCSQWRISGTAPKTYFGGADGEECPVKQSRVVSGEIYAPECCGFDWALGDLRTSCGVGEPVPAT